MSTKNILIINTGGTLSSVMKENGLAPGLSTEEMLKELRMVSGDTKLALMDFCSLDSANIFPEDWSALAAKIGEVRTKYDGIVVIHGTDTLAYTSSMLSFDDEIAPTPALATPPGAAQARRVRAADKRIINAKTEGGAFELPLTGGTGTAMLTIGGVLLLAAVLVVARRRRVDDIA